MSSNVNFKNRPEELKNKAITDHEFTEEIRRKKCPKCRGKHWVFLDNYVFRHNTLYFDRQCDYCGHTETYSKSNYEKYFRLWNSLGLDTKII